MGLGFGGFVEVFGVWRWLFCWEEEDFVALDKACVLFVHVGLLINVARVKGYLVCEVSMECMCKVYWRAPLVYVCALGLWCVLWGRKVVLCVYVRI